MEGGEWHKKIGLCELNWGGCHEGERGEPMPALTLGQGGEQDSKGVIRNSTNDKMWNLVPLPLGQGESGSGEPPLHVPPREIAGTRVNLNPRMKRR
jgi:hypothetical protein